MIYVIGIGPGSRNLMTEEAIKAINNADVIIMGPGSLYTSIIPNLLVKGIPEAICKSPAKKVYISNVMTQPGETDGFKVSNHLKDIRYA